MKNMRIPLLIAWGVALVGIILGSFLDFNVIKVLISDSLKDEDCRTLISDIDNFKQNDNDGVYLFAMYNGDKAKPNEFAFFTRETLRTV